MSRKDKLSDLYDLLVNEMQDRLQHGDEAYVASEGRHVRTKASASTLRAIAQFLQVQGIEATEEHAGLQDLMGMLRNTADRLAEQRDIGD